MKVNLDILSAYLDGVLSPDAERSLQHELKQDEEMRQALEAERRLLSTLDGLTRVSPPADFVNGVMGRVAQHPAHRPAAPIPWRAALQWSVAASLLLVILAGVGVAWLVGSGALEGARPVGLIATGISGAAGLVASGFTATKQLSGPAMAILEEAGQMMWRFSTFAASSGWVVQIGLLLLTVTLNYAFTRLVLGYQRRD